MSVKPLRIVLATDSTTPSGVGRHMITLAQTLAADVGHEVVIAAPPASGLLEDARIAGCTAQAYDAKRPEAFARWLNAFRADVLHVHAGIGWEGHGLVELGLRHRAERDRPVVVLRTEHLPYLLTHSGQKAEHAHWSALVDATVCVSQAVADTHIDAGIDATRMHVVRNGIVPAHTTRDRTVTRDRLGLAHTTTMLLTVARLSEQKGHATLLNAFHIMRDTHPETHLFLVGDGPLRADLDAQIDQAGLQDAVTLLGKRTDVGDLLAACDLFVLPSRFEGFPLSLLEAMAARRPIVATEIGGTMEALADFEPDGEPACAWTAAPDDADSLAAALTAALNDPDERDRRASAAAERFQHHFAAARMGAEMAALYRETVASSTPPYPFPGPPPMTDPDQQEPAERRPTRIGFVGAGGIAHRHLDILASFDDVEVVAFADPDIERAERAAAPFQARAFVGHEAMLEAMDLDALYICIPPFAHGDVERAAIARGIPIFVEKPVALDLDLAQTIAGEIERAGLITATGYHWRYLDTVDEARALLRDNPAQLVSGYWLDSTPPPQWWWKEDQSGGQMVEQATHLLDLARFLLGEVVEVYGRTAYREREAFPGLDVPTTTTATLTFASGVVANIASTCLLGWNHRVGLHLFADRLAVELTDHDIMVDTGHGRPQRRAEGDPVWREDRDFVDAVRGGENRIRAPYADALRSHALALAVLESARTGQPISLDGDVPPRPDPAPLQMQPRPDEDHHGPPPGHRHVRSLGIERPHHAYIHGYDEGPPNDGQVRLDTLYSGFSAGTELTFYKGTNPYLHSRWDEGRGVFQPGEAGLHYPVPFLGYMEVARVAESRARRFPRRSAPGAHMRPQNRTYGGPVSRNARGNAGKH